MERYVRTRLYARQRPFDLLLDKHLIAFGSPEDVSGVARRYADAGLTEFLAITNFGGLKHKRVLRSMELLGRYVLPRVHDDPAPSGSTPGDGTGLGIDSRDRHP